MTPEQKEKYRIKRKENFLLKLNKSFPNLKLISEFYSLEKSVTIKCPKHGNIKQRPNKLLKVGCWKCYCKELAERDKKIRLNKVLDKILEVHGDTYTYPYIEEEFDTNNSYITIICPIHGKFTQQVKNHILQKQRCNKCVLDNKRGTTKTFIDKAKKIHFNKYDYSKTKYGSSNEELIVICPKHGEFPQRASHHLRGQGCPKCNAERFMVGKNEGEVFIPFMRDILSNYDVTLLEQYVVKKDTFQYYVDLYIPEKNLAIEYDEEYHSAQKEKDEERQTYIEKELGCDFVRIDDKPFMKNNNYVSGILSKWFPTLSAESIEDLFE